MCCRLRNRCVSQFLIGVACVSLPHVARAANCTAPFSVTVNFSGMLLGRDAEMSATFSAGSFSSPVLKPGASCIFSESFWELGFLKQLQTQYIDGRPFVGPETVDGLATDGASGPILISISELGFIGSNIGGSPSTTLNTRIDWIYPGDIPGDPPFTAFETVELSCTGPFRPAGPNGATASLPCTADTSPFGSFGSGTATVIVSWTPNPVSSPLTIVNPFAPYARYQQPPQALSIPAVLNADPVSSLAADGNTAVVIIYKSTSSQPVTFALSASGAELPSSAAIGSLSPFAPDYLTNPHRSTSNLSLPVTGSSYGPDADGSYYFLALLWAPDAMPLPNSFPAVNITLTATQITVDPVATSITLEPPPLLLVHGVWSSAKEAGFAPGSQGFGDWISHKYPHNLIFGVDYGTESFKDFTNLSIQHTLLSNMTDALAAAAMSGLAARTVDVFAHSMGGLVTRYFLSPSGSAVRAGNPALLPNPVHKLITIGTPHQGTLLTTALEDNLTATATNVFGAILCSAKSVSPCNLLNLFNAIGKKVDTAIASMEPDSTQLKALSPQPPYSAITYNAIIGNSVVPAKFSAQITEPLLNIIISGFVLLPGNSIETILGTTSHDTIVPAASQGGSDPNPVTIPVPIVHTNLCGSVFIPNIFCPDVGETASRNVWSQAYWWLTGGVNAAPATTTSSAAPFVTATAPPPTLDLTGYTKVSESLVTFDPTTGSTLPINSVTNITATSSKTITELLLFQTVTDPTDTVLFVATQSPFSISFTPTRLGAANFAVIVVFSDLTYAVTTLNYTLQTSRAAYALKLLNAPVANMTIGSSRVINASALYANGQIDVTGVANYAARSGVASVFKVSAGGTITAVGNGIDLLDVSYGGATATASVAVGACIFAVTPSNQTIPYTGAMVTIQIATQPGCAWTASTTTSWLTLNGGSGTGSGSFSFTAAANSSATSRPGTVEVARQTVTLTQVGSPVTLSAYSAYTAAGGSTGSVNVAATSSDATWTATSNVSWITITAGANGTGNGTVTYSVAANSTGAQRVGTITIGGQTFTITQAALSAGLAFYPVPPCRIIDTRRANGMFGGPAISAQGTRTVPIPQSTCNIPASALAYSLNVTAVPLATLGYLSIWPAGQSQPVVSTLNSFDGSIVANAAIVPAGAQGAVNVFTSDATQVILDINGYFAPASTANGLGFYILPPCRVVDTRRAAGPLAGPLMSGGSARSFPLTSSPCGAPSTAQAYSLNITVAPRHMLGYLTSWPTGQTQPFVSTLNSQNGLTVANAAIVPAGTNGAISIFVTDDTDVIIDINGYFAPPGSPAAQSLYTVTPCRVADTRPRSTLIGGGLTNFSIGTSPCGGIPNSAQAYSLNFTVVPHGPLGYLTAWPAGQPQPDVSTLNSPAGKVVANAAIVPSGANGAISVFVTNTTDLILDINAYFAP